MGGMNEKRVNGLRMHISGNEVHIHDDSKNLKFTRDAEDFTADINGAFKEFDSSTIDGVIRINADVGADLCLVKEGKCIYPFLFDRVDAKQELVMFLKGI